MWRESEEERDCERRAAGWALVDIVELPTRRESRVNYTRGRGLWQCLRLSLSLSLSLSLACTLYLRVGYDTRCFVPTKEKGPFPHKGLQPVFFFHLISLPLSLHISSLTLSLSLSFFLFLFLWLVAHPSFHRGPFIILPFFLAGSFCRAFSRDLSSSLRESR